MSFASRRVPTIASWLVIALALAILPSAAGAQTPPRGDLVLSGSPASDTTGSGGQVTYSVNIKNDGSISARGVDAAVTLPANATFVRCSTSVAGQLCAHSAGVVTTTFHPVGFPATFGAHSTETFNVVIKNPVVSQKTVITVHAEATATEGVGGMEPRADSIDITGTVVPEVVNVVLHPSLLTDVVACGQVLAPSFFGSDNMVQFTDNLACPTALFGIKIATSAVTLNLAGKKLIGAVSNSPLGSVGIVIAADATDVTILGGTTSNAGIEYFDYCFKDEGGNTGLVVDQLRCFRARSAGFDIVSDGVRLDKVLVDRTVGGSATAEPPGGVGIRASGNVHVKQSIARRSNKIGIWADGAVDPDGNGRVVQIDSQTQVQDAEGVGILLDGQFHLVKDVIVDGNGVTGTSTNGVVINGSDMTVDGVSVKQFGQNGFIVNGNRVRIERSGVDTSRLDAFIIQGANASLNGNRARLGRHGFVIGGSDVVMDTNTAESIGGTGFIVTGARAVMNANRAKKVKGDGFNVSGAGGTYNTNAAESNVGTGFIISGNDGNFQTNSSYQSTSAGGWLVTGTNNRFKTNSGNRNSGSEWNIGAGNIDVGGNSKNGRGFSFTSAGGVFE